MPRKKGGKTGEKSREKKTTLFRIGAPARGSAQCAVVLCWA
jgi:hypothetical protein